MAIENRMKKEIRAVVISMIDAVLGHENWKTPNHPIVAAPATPTSTGTAGEVRIVTGFAYFCVSTDVWERVAIATWTP